VKKMMCYNGGNVGVGENIGIALDQFIRGSLINWGLKGIRFDRKGIRFDTMVKE
jgi:hypothetical protein